METSHWPQGIGVVRVATTGDNTREKKPKPEQNLNCPRCNSTNTKFCYYNNYSLTQPRYFCKTCRRYWTEGGTLRNVPVGGGSRRKQRPSSSSKKLDLTTPPPKFPSQNPKMNLGNYNPPMFNTIPPHELVALPLPFALDQPNPNFSTTISSSPHLSFLELLKTTGNFTSAGANPVLDSDPVLISHGFPMHEFKIPALDHHGVVENSSGYGNLQDQTSSSRMVFPFGESNKGGAVEQDDGGVQEESNIGSYWNNNSNNGGSW